MNEYVSIYYADKVQCFFKFCLHRGDVTQLKDSPRDVYVYPGDMNLNNVRCLGFGDVKNN